MPDFSDAAESVLAALRTRGQKLATAESCTGGLIAAALTAIAGSSDVFERGFVTYSNDSKTELLGVPETMLAAHGAVSAETAEAMASGALQNSRADIAISVTGIAGPGGGSADKPVGLVYIGLAAKGHDTQHFRHQFSGDRDEVREQTVKAGLRHISDLVQATSKPFSKP